MIGRAVSRGQAKILDFGLARIERTRPVGGGEHSEAHAMLNRVPLPVGRARTGLPADDAAARAPKENGP